VKDGVDDHQARIERQAQAGVQQHGVTWFGLHDHRHPHSGSAGENADPDNYAPGRAGSNARARRLTKVDGVVLQSNHLERRNQMDHFTNKLDVVTGDGGVSRLPSIGSIIDSLIRTLIKIGITNKDIDYHLIRLAMVIIFLFFGYQKWFEYEARALTPFISNGPFIFWLYPVFGIRGATWFLGISEWTFGTLLFLGFWNKKLGILGALGSCVTFIGTVTIIPFMPDGWAASAGGFPAMTENVAFLMKDVVLFSVSVYLLKQDVMRASSSTRPKAYG
jgi:uncharacterized membrane protein YkgB